MAIPAFGRTSALKRRSTRIPLNSSVAVSGEDCSKCSFTIGAKATGLNKHGGAIQIIRELLVGTTVEHLRRAQDQARTGRERGQSVAQQLRQDAPRERRRP